MLLRGAWVNHHGLKRILSEGLTIASVADYGARIDVFRKLERGELPEFRKQLASVREILDSKVPGRVRHKNATGIEKEIAALIRSHEPRMLEVGIPGRLLISGEIDTVEPLDDADALKGAKPLTRWGKIVSDSARLKARQDAIVRSALEREPDAFIVLGGSHDLSDSVRRLGGGVCVNTSE